MRKRSKVAEEIMLIAELSLGIPTAALLSLSPLWWGVEPIKVFAGYLLTIVGIAALCAVISVRDEVAKK